MAGAASFGLRKPYEKLTATASRSGLDAGALGRERSKYREARELWKQAQKRFAAVIGEADAADLRNRLLRLAYDERLTVAPAPRD